MIADKDMKKALEGELRALLLIEHKLERWIDENNTQKAYVIGKLSQYRKVKRDKRLEAVTSTA